MVCLTRPKMKLSITVTTRTSTQHLQRNMACMKLMSNDTPGNQLTRLWRTECLMPCLDVISSAASESRSRARKEYFRYRQGSWGIKSKRKWSEHITLKRKEVYSLDRMMLDQSDCKTWRDILHTWKKLRWSSGGHLLFSWLAGQICLLQAVHEIVMVRPVHIRVGLYLMAQH